MDYRIEGHKIIFSNGSSEKIVLMDYPILRHKVIKDKLLILLEYSKAANSNILAYNLLNGDLLWNIQEDPLSETESCPYVGMQELNDYSFTAFTWCCFRSTINIDTGKIMDRVFTK
jgi:hypothetical protein